MIAPGSAAAKVHAQALSAVRPGPAIRCHKMPAPPHPRAPHGGRAPFQASVGRPSCLPTAGRLGSRPHGRRALRNVGGAAGGRASSACRARMLGATGRRMRGVVSAAPPAARGPCADARPGAALPHEPQPAPAPAVRAAPTRDGCIPPRGRHRRAPRREAGGPRAARPPAPPAAPLHRAACEGAARPAAERGEP